MQNKTLHARSSAPHKRFMRLHWPRLCTNALYTLGRHPVASSSYSSPWRVSRIRYEFMPMAVLYNICLSFEAWNVSYSNAGRTKGVRTPAQSNEHRIIRLHVQTTNVNYINTKTTISEATPYIYQRSSNVSMPRAYCDGIHHHHVVVG